MKFIKDQQLLITIPRSLQDPPAILNNIKVEIGVIPHQAFRESGFPHLARAREKHKLPVQVFSDVLREIAHTDYFDPEVVKVKTFATYGS